MDERTVNWINRLGAFCGTRDIPELTQGALERAYGFRQADVLVLFGGSILCGGDILADAMREQVAKRTVIVGGEGHTTQALRDTVHREIPQICTQGLPEAQVFAAYLNLRYGLAADFLECTSTNCGNNITCLLELLREHHVDWDSIILCQDAAMQRRMDAGLRKYAPRATIINFASYAVKTAVRHGELAIEYPPRGMWTPMRYLELLMGEIPRLMDNESGYGPRGKGYIAHVDIPEEVLEAFEGLRKEYAGLVRRAYPMYASREDGPHQSEW